MLLQADVVTVPVVRILASSTVNIVGYMPPAACAPPWLTQREIPTSTKKNEQRLWR